MKNVNAVVFLCCLAASSEVFGFTLETVATRGCHEQLSLAALDNAGWPSGTAAPSQTDADRELAANLQFHPPSGADSWTLALLIGVRDSDLGGASPTDLPRLAAVQNGAGEQHLHCLRELNDNGAAGDMTALQACRQVILDEVAAALGDDDILDLEATESHRVDLAFEDRDLPLSRYAFHLGKAAHALEDSFAHTFRTPDAQQVQSVHTYVGPQQADYQPSVMGYSHQSSMDSCDEHDVEAAARAGAATRAVAQLFAAVGAQGNRPERLQRAQAVVDRWLAYAPGCDEGNAWCGHVTSAGGCSSAGGKCSLFAAALLPLLALRRRRSAGTSVMLLAMLGSLVARAEPAATLDAAESPVPAHDGRRGGVHLAVGSSFDNPGANLLAGVRLALSPRITLGFDFEASPWLDPISGRVAPGTFDAFATASWRWGGTGSLEVRSVIDAGTSVLLFRAEGANKGSVGLFVGTSLLQLRVKLSDALTLELTPEVVVAVPSLEGVPLAYRQYRVSMGLEWLL
jgi:hypothetical protein